jgi:hypothetical protein
MIQKEYWCLIWNMNMQSASSIWSNLLSNATVNIIEIVRNCVCGGVANVYGSSYYWNFRTSSFKQVACLILFYQQLYLLKSRLRRTLFNVSNFDVVSRTLQFQHIVNEYIYGRMAAIKLLIELGVKRCWSIIGALRVWWCSCP